MNRCIKCEQEILVFENNWVRVYFDRVSADDPKVQRYTRIVESDGKSGVAILPIWKDLIGLVHVFRYPIGREVWEIPRGFGESNDVLMDAKRELEEETGLFAPKFCDLGLIHPNSGLLSSSVRLFAAVFQSNAGDTKPKDSEVIEFKWFQVDKVYEMIRAGQLADGFAMAAIFRALQERLLPAPGQSPAANGDK
jgi:8-oxo-dGTP pyrophosphatase MutT (NUDIX family)